MSEKIKVEIELPESYLENKDMLLWGLIRYVRKYVNDSDVPGELKEFWDETPMSTTEIRKLFNFTDRSNFSYHFSAFKKFIKEEYNRDIIPLIWHDKWADIYTKWVVREFLAYMNRNGTKIAIKL